MNGLCESDAVPVQTKCKKFRTLRGTATCAFSRRHHLGRDKPLPLRFAVGHGLSAEIEKRHKQQLKANGVLKQEKGTN